MQALIALGQIGSAAEPAVPAIIAAIKDDEPAVRYGAEFALGKLRATEAAGDLEKLTTSTDPTLKLVATWAIARIHPDDATAVHQAMEVIADGIRSDDPQLSRIAAQALAEVDASSQAITPAIRAALDEMDPTVIEHVIEALATVGAKAVPVLTAAMKDAKTRGAAIRALGRIGQAATPAVADLAAALGDKDPQIASDAALTLAAIGPDAAKAVPATTAYLPSRTPAGADTSVLALGASVPRPRAPCPAC